MSQDVPPHCHRFIRLLKCPACGGDLRSGEGMLRCAPEGHTFPIENGIPHLFVPNDWEPGKADVTATVKQFYEKTPFPNYDAFDSVAALMEKSRKGLFARLLDEQVPVESKVLEVGCGTGQLSNFLGIAQRDVFGADICLNSLGLAEDFRRKNQLSRVGFYQMNLFRPIFREETFDLLISNGVLHHTSDPFGAFKGVSRLVKKGGYVLIGLYNTYGRLMTDLRRVVFRLTGDRFAFLDSYLRERGKRDAKMGAWFADQYQHPHESKHTMGEVLKWFDGNGVDFRSGIPSLSLEPYDEAFQLFAPHDRGNVLTHAISQLKLVFTGSTEGGFYILIGRKR